MGNPTILRFHNGTSECLWVLRQEYEEVRAELARLHALLPDPELLRRAAQNTDCRIPPGCPCRVCAEDRADAAALRALADKLETL